MIAPDTTTMAATLRHEAAGALLGTVFSMVGLCAIILSQFRRPQRDLTLISFGVFCSLYGVRLLAGLTSVQVTIGRALPWPFLVTFITYVIGIPATVFYIQLLGPGWRSSLRALFWLSIAFACVAVFSDVLRGVPFTMRVPNGVLVIAGGVVMLINLFRPGVPVSPELQPAFDLRAELFRMTGTDLTQIEGVNVVTALTILSEAGTDMSKWPDENHFVSWLRLCPDNRISGDKIIGKSRLPTNNRASVALRMAASTLRLSDTYLGAQFRRLRTKLGAPIAIKAMAAKLARLIYRMLRYGMRYADQGAKPYETQQRNRQIRYLKRKATQLGLHIIQLQPA